jgi:hypothetical protein
VRRREHHLGDRARVDSKPSRRAGLLLLRYRNIRPLQRGIIVAALSACTIVRKLIALVEAQHVDFVAARFRSIWVLSQEAKGLEALRGLSG